MDNSPLTFENATQRLLDLCCSFGTETLHISEALGRVTSEPVKSRAFLPRFPIAIKDGFAVDSNAFDKFHTRNVALKIIDSDVVFNTEGSDVLMLSRFDAMPIRVGEPLPPGANTVVPHKYIKVNEDKTISILTSVIPDQNIKPMGKDCRVGEVLMDSYTVIHAAEVGKVLSAGVTKISVFRLPRVAVLSVGNDVQPTRVHPLGSYQQYSAAHISVLALLKQHGFPHFDRGFAIDQKGGKLMDCLKENFQGADVLVTVGGVSLGWEDNLKHALKSALKAEVVFAGIHMKPDNPLTVMRVSGRSNNSKVVFCLPSDPHTCMVSSHLFLMPGLRLFAQYSRYFNIFPFKAKLDHPVSLLRMPQFLQGCVDKEAVRITECKLPVTDVNTCNAIIMLPAASAERQSLWKHDVVSVFATNIL